MGIQKIDIQGYGYQLKRTLTKLKTGELTYDPKGAYNLSPSNRNVLLEYYDYLRRVEGLKDATILKILEKTKRILGIFLKKDYDKVTIEDIDKCFKDLGIIYPHPEDLTTRLGYRRYMRKFFTWTEFRDNTISNIEQRQYGTLVKHLRVNPTKAETKQYYESTRKIANDMITSKEAEKLIEFAPFPMDKALIGVLNDTGARIGEVGNAQMKHLRIDKNFYYLTLKGKTETREVLILEHSKLLTNWLNQHPDKDNPEAPLFCHVQTIKRGQPIKYGTIRQMLHRTAKKAGIKKRIHPHLFRHSRVTQLSDMGIDQQKINSLLGWTPDTRMMNIYSHLTTKQANDELIHKLVGEDPNKPRFEVKLEQEERLREIETQQKALLKFLHLVATGSIDIDRINKIIWTEVDTDVEDIKSNDIYKKVLNSLR